MVLGEECSFECNLQALCPWDRSLAWIFIFKLTLPFFRVLVSDPTPQTVGRGHQGYGSFNLIGFGKHGHQRYQPLVWDRTCGLNLIKECRKLLHGCVWEGLEEVESNAVQAWSFVGKELDGSP